MQKNKMLTHAASSRLNSDFWKYWSGQTISNFGNSITLFALPLLVYQLTGSAINLGLSTAANFLPYLLFGLFLGALTDRVNRKRMMIVVDLMRGLIVATIPLFAALGWLQVWWIYAVGFLHSTLTISFDSGQFAAIPSLVEQDDLVTANGRIQASYSAAMVIGPILAGLLIALMPVSSLVLLDACSFLLSAFSLVLIRKNFNASSRTEQSKSILHDALEGLRYVLGHPVLRNISFMMALYNIVANAMLAQLVLFAKERLHASDAQVGLLYSAASIGMVVFSLLAGTLRKRWSFSKVALSALMIMGLLDIALAFTPWLWLALIIQGCTAGLGILFNINTASLRQSIVPDHMLGRVMSIAGVLAWSAIPLGAVAGGYAVAWTHSIVLVYAVIGVLNFLIPLGFSFSALGRAEEYLPKSVNNETHSYSPRSRRA